tara:strand:- start:519 stop:1073 length:555 start_codon:yes stop_codon:yes gene_type:complete
MIRNLYVTFLVLAVCFSCKSPDARRPVKRTSGSFIKESVERNKKLIAQQEAVIASIMDKDTLNEYIASESGFWYYYQVKDSTSNKLPVFGDRVTFTYDIKNLNGTTILSENENGLQNYIVDQSNQELISGIRDGIKLMKEGETVTFLFPSHKAFGYYGLEEKIGTNVPVQSTITLKTIHSSENN